jgi:hypothetical protein
VKPFLSCRVPDLKLDHFILEPAFLRKERCCRDANPGKLSATDLRKATDNAKRLTGTDGRFFVLLKVVLNESEDEGRLADCGFA